MKKAAAIKNLILLVFILLFLFIFVFAFYFIDYANVSKKVMVNPNIYGSIENKVPISDTVGVSIDIDEVEQGVIDEALIEIKASSNSDEYFNYELFLEEENVDMRISGNYIKVCLFDENDNIVNSINNNEIPTFSNLKVSSSFAYARRIYFGKIKNGQIRIFKLRIWLADNYFVGSELRKFRVKVGAKVVR